MRSMTNTSGEERSAQKAAYQRPKTRQRIHKNPTAIVVPNINDDATERKRALSVLAQRRYRERKRLRQAASTGNDDGSEVSTGSERLVDSSDCVSAVTGVLGDTPEGPGDGPLNSSTYSCVDLSSSSSLSQADTFSSLVLPSLGLFVTNHEGSPTVQPASDPLATIDPAALLYTPSPTESPISLPADSYFLPMSELTLLRAFMRIADRLGCTDSVWDLAAVSPFYNQYPMSSSTSSSTQPSSSLDPSLNFRLESNPMATTTVRPSVESLPPPWEPTASQLLIQHHPVLDFLPWPSARDRIISIFALPEKSRPEAARGPLALVQLVYDIEDSAEGMRIWGGNPYDPMAWEVGQILFERWWFVFDRDIINQSDRWRQLRGAASLKMAPPSEMG